MISVSGGQSVDISFFKMFRSGLFERFFLKKKTGTRCYKRDKIWGNANSLLKWLFRSRCRRCCLSSLFLCVERKGWGGGGGGVMKGAGRCLPTVTVFRQFKQRHFWATHVNRKWTFFLAICLDTTKFVVLLCVFSLMCWKSRLKSAKSILPVDVRRSKTSLVKVPFMFLHTSKAASCSSFVQILRES